MYLNLTVQINYSEINFKMQSKIIVSNVYEQIKKKKPIKILSLVASVCY